MVTIKRIDDKYMLIDGDKTVECKVNEEYRDGPIIKIPENSSNRRYLMVKKFNEVQVNDEVQLSEKEYKPIIKGGLGKKPTISTKGWTEYMTDEEKAKYDELTAQIDAIHQQVVARINSPLEKAKRALEEAKKAYEALLAQTNQD